jgi:hypothetical protein
MVVSWRSLQAVTTGSYFVVNRRCGRSRIPDEELTRVEQLKALTLHVHLRLRRRLRGDDGDVAAGCAGERQAMME